MALSVRCPNCGQHYELPEQLGGRTGKCSACQSAFQVPFVNDFVSAGPASGRPQTVPPRKWSPILIVGNILFLGVVPLVTIAVIAWLVTRSHQAAEPAGADTTTSTASTAAQRSRAPSPRANTEELLRQLGSPDVAARGKAARELGEELAPTVVQRLLNTAITDKASAVRCEALQSLGLAGPGLRDRLYEPLLRLQTDPDTAVRRAAAEALVRYGPPSYVQLSTLRAALKDPVAEVRILAARLLEAMGPAATAAIPELAVAATDRSPEVRLSAVKILARIGGEKPERRTALIAAANDAEAEVRRAAVTGLRLLGNRPGVLSALFRAAEKSPGDVELQQELAAALSNFDSVAAEDAAVVSQGLRSSSPQVQAWAANQLGRLGADGAAALPELAAALRQAADARRRLDLLEAIRRILEAGRYDRGATPAQLAKLAPMADAFAALLDDPDIGVRSAVLPAIGLLGPAAEKMVPALQKRLVDPMYALATVTVLGQIGPPAAAAVPDLMKVLEGQKFRIEPRLVGVDPGTGRGFYRNTIVNPTLDPLREATAQALAHVGPVAVPALIKALRHKNHAVRLAACEALERIGPPAKEALKALEGLAIAKDVEFAPIRKAAREAAKAIKGGPRAP